MAHTRPDIAKNVGNVKKRPPLLKVHLHHILLLNTFEIGPLFCQAHYELI